LLVAVGTEAQIEFDVITHHTESLFDNAEVVNEAVDAACKFPFTYHWYAGPAPPFTAVATKVTEPLAHITGSVGLILTDGALMLLTVIMILALATTAGVAQTALEVSTHHMVSLLASVLLEYTDELVPTFAPFFFH
jgi:hypothetical protein